MKTFSMLELRRTIGGLFVGLFLTVFIQQLSHLSAQGGRRLRVPRDDIRLTTVNVTTSSSPYPVPVTKRIYIDLGANCGNSYALFKERIDEAHLFEPQPAVFEEWLKPLAASTPGVHAYGAAISDSDGQLDFFVDGVFPSKICTFHQGYPHGASSVLKGIAGSGSTKVTVKSMDIALFMYKILAEQGASKPYLIVKIDIEGMETRILNRLRSNKLLCHVNELLIEWHCSTGPGCRPENHDVMFREECPGLNYTEWII
jgi:FkbM family methyltransferase